MDSGVIPDGGGPDVGGDTGVGMDTGVDAPPAAHCATPTFTPVAGTFATPQSVKIATTTPGATIFYTSNGTNPTTADQVFDTANPISVAATTTIRAICTAPNFAQSQVGSATYTIVTPVGNVSAPSFSSPNGATTQDNDFLLGLTTNTAGATICFAFNQSHPTCTAGVCGASSQTYGGTGVPISGSVTNASTGQVTVNALSCMAGSTNSTEVTQTYTLKVATPSLNGPAPGTLPLGAGTDITPLLSTATTGAVSAFANPTASATPCTTGTALNGALPKNVTVHTTNGHQVLTYQACKAGYAGSDIYTATYDFKLAVPTLTPAVAGTTDRSIMVSVSNPGNNVGGTWTCTTSDSTTAACGATTNTCAGTGTVGATPAVTVTGTKLSSVACAPGFVPSNAVAGGPYTLQLDPVTFTPGDGTNIASNVTGIQVTMAENPVLGQQFYDFICWTDDGSTPDCTCTPSAHVHNAPGHSVMTGVTSVVPGMTLKALGCLASTNPLAFTPSVTSQATYSGPNTTNVPSVTPVGGSFSNDTVVTIKNADAVAAVVCYTTDGTAPACDVAKTGCAAGVTFSAAATGTIGDSVPITITQTNTTVTAVACTPTKTNSGAQVQTYTLTAGAPLFDVPGGQIDVGTTVNWTSGPVATPTAGATFAFTTDGTTPLCNAAGMQSSFTPTVATPSIKVIACKPKYAPSAVVAQTYTFIVEPPTLSPNGSVTYMDAVSVAMTDPVSNGNICYTFNGTSPGCQSSGACAAGATQYMTPQLVSQSGTNIRAVACVAGLPASAEVSATYTLHMGALTLTPNPAQAQTTAQDISVTLATPPVSPYVLCTVVGSNVTIPPQPSAPGTCGTAMALATYLNMAGAGGHTWACFADTASSTLLTGQTTSVRVSAVACKEGLVWSTTQASYAFNPYSRTFQFNDGVNRFVDANGAETLATDLVSVPGGYHAYMSWDATNLVFGFGGFTANDGSTVDVYFGDGVAGTKIPDQNAPVTLPALSKNALYHLVWNDMTAQATIRQWNSTLSSWQASAIPVVLGYSGGGSQFVEFGIARSAIGNPGSLFVVGGLLSPTWPATGSTYTTVWPFPPNSPAGWVGAYSVDFAAASTPAMSPIQ
ncbi:MAG: chitobiase/beta-hexosaminidase C-terminal domain-containing protein [Myxococcota bacterium]|nr:chitobiase/beta-hexosaminidase C-terminal domain-containing protein [Myxococcota bacterium]